MIGLKINTMVIILHIRIKVSGENAMPKKLLWYPNAIGIKSTAGRYGGTYAHKDIAFEFGSWLSLEFKLYLIKQKLVEIISMSKSGSEGFF
jgi:hypothetical protein